MGSEFLEQVISCNFTSRTTCSLLSVSGYQSAIFFNLNFPVFHFSLKKIILPDQCNRFFMHLSSVYEKRKIRLARQTHCCNQCPDPVLLLLIQGFFPFHQYIMFLKERTIRPSRMPGKIIVFQVLCFILLLLDDLEAFIWNYYLEQS